MISVGRIVWSRICRIWGDFQDGRGDANRCVFGRVFDRCLNCDFWDYGDGLWASFQF